MRIRTIKPEFWEHPVMSRQSDATRLLAIGLLNLSDDEGYFYADPKIVRNHLRQQDDDSLITHGALTELSKIGYISFSEHHTHGRIGKVVEFMSHQVINRPTPSKIKALYDSGSAHGVITEDSPPERKGKEGKGRGKEVPPNPQGGMDDQDGRVRILPKNWEKMKAADQNRTRVNLNSKTMTEIGKMFGRREGTLWSVAEAVALKSVNPSPEEIALMGTYYLAHIAKDQDFRRRDLLTLLNNWNGELDRARIFEPDLFE